jgi:HK97 family phage prohead protease/HK97 family phage major capsid protein
MDKTKVLYLNSAFSIKGAKDSLPLASDKIDSIFIEGYASTNDVDRAGDVVSTSVWEKGIQNYLKNPIILAQHDHDDPVGRMVDYRIDDKGLWIKARVSAAAEIFNLVKDKVLTAFSIGFRVVDAEYNAAAEIFMVKELELVEISIVSVPCNQNTIFSLAKAFNGAEEYNEFKKQFAATNTVAKELEVGGSASTTTQKEWNMNPEEIKQMLADAAKSAAEQATKSLLAAQAEQEAKALAEAKAQEDFDAKVKAAVAASVKTVDTGAERLLAEVTQRLEAQSAESKSALAGLEAAIKEKAAELAKIQASKMQFGDSQNAGEVTYADREKAVLLSKITGKSIEDTKFGKQLATKANNVGGHLPTTAGQSVWELEVSLNMENEVRRRLVVVPNIRAITMQTNVMTIPVNPEAGLATWVTNANFGAAPASLGAAGASAGTTATHQLKDITLNAYKLATNEYMNYEEEEDSLIVLLPIVRDAMVRRVARSMDRAYLYGAGSGSDPVKGLATWASAATSLTTGVTGAASGVVTVAALRAMRKDLGAWGLDPAEIVFVVSTDIYYQLLEDTTFQTMNQVGVQATLLTGQIGSIGNTPVLVSGEFATKANGTVGAICFAPGNFLAGNQRGLRFDTQELVETQRRVLVASLRTGMTQVTTNLGNGVAKLVHTA